MEKFEYAQLLKKYSPSFAAAYGSGVFAQNNYHESERPMIDFIFGVENPVEWHQRNLSANPRDYALPARFLNALDTRVLPAIQELGPGMFYNAFVQFQDSKIKYGVISLARLEKDLLEWQELYSAGRLQKPARILATTPAIEQAQASNLEQALNTASLLLPEKFSPRELFLALASLSYNGDSRVGIAENGNKIKNIVDRNLPEFEALYAKAISNADWLARSNNQFEQDISDSTLEARLAALPQTLRNNMPLSAAGNFSQLPQEINNALKQIVFPASVKQALKGIITAGPRNALKYLVAKIRKSYR